MLATMEKLIVNMSDAIDNIGRCMTELTKAVDRTGQVVQKHAIDTKNYRKFGHY